MSDVARLRSLARPGVPGRSSGEPSGEIFARPVRSQTAFEETLERLGNAIRLGLLAPGTRLPAERELCEQLGIARSTLRQALTALVQSGHLRRGARARRRHVRGRARRRSHERPTPRCSRAGATRATRGWRSSSASRCSPPSARPPRAIGPLEELVAAMDGLLGDFPAYRQADVRFHVGLAEATGSTALVAAMTEAQARDDRPDPLHRPPARGAAWSNAQHARLVTCLERRDPRPRWP